MKDFLEDIGIVAFIPVLIGIAIVIIFFTVNFSDGVQGFPLIPIF